MNSPQRVLDLIYLGYYLERLYHPDGLPYDSVVNELHETLEVLSRLGYTGFLAKLDDFVNKVKTAHEQTPDEFKDNSPFNRDQEVIPYGYLTELNELVRGIFGTLNNKARDWEVVRIDRGVISDSLRGLHANARDQHYKTLVSEAMTCLECGSYRSAIVMGWNLAFDHFRQWIFSSKRKRLKALNTVLTNKKRTPLQVMQYDDFFDLSERVLIDDAYEARLFKKNTHKFLIGSLDTRNSFAHPSHMEATATSAAGYIDLLIRNVIANPHFEFKKRTTS